MADELLDLVNEKDEIIGEVWKSEANTNPKVIHREIAIVIYDDAGDVLFQKRSLLKKVNPGIWAETVAGHVGKGENPLIAAHRELSEELGFDTNLYFFEKKLARMPTETHFTYWYTGKFPKGTNIVVQKEEVEETRFMSPEELKSLVDSGEVYDPIVTGGQPEDMVKKLWHKLDR